MLIIELGTGTLTMQCEPTLVLVMSTGPFKDMDYYGQLMDNSLLLYPLSESLKSFSDL